MESEAVSYSVQNDPQREDDETSQQTLMIGFNARHPAETASFHPYLPHLLSLLPLHYTQLPTKVQIGRYTSPENVEALLAAARGMNVTHLRVAFGAVTKILDHLTKDRPWLFPALQELVVNLRGVPHGVLRSMVQSRYADAEEGRPIHFTLLAVTEAGPEHEEDWDVIHTVVGPNNSHWT